MMLSRSFASRASSLMKGILVKEFGGPEQCKLVHDLPIPEPNDDQIQIHVNSFGINPIDTYIRTGTHQRRPKLPYIPGFDCAGVISKLGKNVKNFKVGDRVFTVDSDSGTYADYTLCKSKSVFCLPQNLSFHEGSALGVPYFTAYKSLFLSAKSKPGETVLVHGASGATGIACVQIAKAFGLKVIGTAGTTEGLNLVKSQGADEAFNHREADYVERMKRSHPEGIDIILEMNGQTNLNTDLELLKHRQGRVMVIGCRGPVEINPRLLMSKDTSISGVLVFNSTEEEFRMMNANLQSFIKLNCIKPIIAKVYSIENTSQAHKDVTYNNGKLGRLTVHVN